ncbi:hypothetical protein TIFTF001_021917 [Ficus carica]|uniref:Uncharacterized protein n=1 Tax=Ficus carica TaxID=3494 RepID=A0AA88AIX8_FICCA|nr:hypothetical protein TIFTF001_021917 [Ficus carica]
MRKKGGQWRRHRGNKREDKAAVRRAAALSAGGRQRCRLAGEGDSG